MTGERDHSMLGPMRPLQLRVKHGLDRVGAACLLAVSAPLLLACAAAIKLEDRGPVLFRQERLGQDARPFMMWKLRSMVADADALLSGDGRVTADRVTRVGRVLRTTSLDELPQLVNIVRGEMSFVGPRPVLPLRLHQLDAQQRRRFQMRPGITGLAQVEGRNTVRWSQRLQLDVGYVERFSFALDCRIMLRTVAIVVRRGGVVLDRNPEQVDDLPRAGR